jgi:hypothetical protein
MFNSIPKAERSPLKQSRHLAKKKNVLIESGVNRLYTSLFAASS